MSDVLIAGRCEELPAGYELALLPPAARAGFIPVTALPWLEAVRLRHERLVERLADAVGVPTREHREHEERVAGWHGEVRAAAQHDEEPPAWNARLSSAWLAGRLDAAEAAIADVVGEIVALLRETEQACIEHGLDALVAAVDDGFGGALLAKERELQGLKAPPPLPSWAPAVRAWRSARHNRLSELERYIDLRRQAVDTPVEEQ